MKVLNPITITPKDLFIARLNGDVYDFGLLGQQDYLSFYTKLIELKLVAFYSQKEYRARIAMFKALDAFSFKVQDEGNNYTVRTVRIDTGDWLELTEIMRASDYMVQSSKISVAKEHLFFMDFDNNQRNKIYKAFNFDV